MAEPVEWYVVYGLMFTDVWMQVGLPVTQKDHAEYLRDFLQTKGIEAMIQRQRPAPCSWTPPRTLTVDKTDE